MPLMSAASHDFSLITMLITLSFIIRAQFAFFAARCLIITFRLIRHATPRYVSIGRSLLTMPVMPTPPLLSIVIDLFDLFLILPILPLMPPAI